MSPIIKKYKQGSITADEAKLLGYFAAEGSYGKKYGKRQCARFTLNINEINTIAVSIKSLAQKVFEKCSVNIHEQKGNTCSVYITGKGVCDFFYKNVGEYSGIKKLHQDLVLAALLHK